MVPRLAAGLIVAICALGNAGVAKGQDRIRAYFNDTALRVQATESAVQKREILGRDLGAMIKALDAVQSAPLTSDEDELGLARLETNLREKSAELEGTEGFVRVPDGELNAFAAYVVQDMEQAHTITISTVTLLLIIIIIILIA